MLATTPRRKLPQPLLLAVCLLLGACTTVGPDFVRPEVPWLAALVEQRAAVGRG